MSAITPAPEVKPSTGGSFFGHPKMLANLFTVEMWERFSFYGMQVLMLYYLYYGITEGGLGLDKSAATGVIGAYGAIVYLMAILGGIFGDRILGPERALFYSAIGIMAGHIALAFVPGVPGVVIGLLLVAIGSGGLKSNASVLVGSLYTKEDTKRDAGFTIFYIGGRPHSVCAHPQEPAQIGARSRPAVYRTPEGYFCRDSRDFRRVSSDNGGAGDHDPNQPQRLGSGCYYRWGHRAFHPTAHRQERNQRRTLAGMGLHSPLDCQRRVLGSIPTAIHRHGRLLG